MTKRVETLLRVQMQALFATVREEDPQSGQRWIGKTSSGLAALGSPSMGDPQSGE